MRGGKRIGAARKKKPDHLRRELVTIRLPPWIISQIKSKGIKQIIYQQGWSIFGCHFYDIGDLLKKRERRSILVMYFWDSTGLFFLKHVTKKN